MAQTGQTTGNGSHTAGRLVAVVVTCNRLEKLRQTVERLLQSPSEVLAAVVVVDNASGDGTAGWLRKHADSRLLVHRLDVNTGGAGGFEVGLRWAMAKLAPDWVVVMDDDARPDPLALERFHAADLRGWDAVAASVRTPDGDICEMNRPTLNPFWHWRVFLRTVLGGGRGAFHLGPAAYDSAQVRRVDGASFVGLFLSRDAIARAGYPDGRLFLYGDDALYTMKLTARGGQIGFMPDLRFEHDSTTLSAADRTFRPLWKVYFYHRNLLLLYRVAAGRMFWLTLPIVLPRWLSQARRYRGTDRGIFLRLMRRAITDGLTGRIGATHAEVLDWAGAEQVVARPSAAAAE